MKVKAISDIVKQVCAQPNFNKQEKLEILRKNDHPGLRGFLTLLFAEDIKWALPEGTPPHKPSDLTDNEGILYNELQRMYIFMEGGHPNLTQRRRELLFIQLLEAIPPADAELVIAMKDHKPPKGITKKLVEEAYGLASV